MNALNEQKNQSFRDSTKNSNENRGIITFVIMVIVMGLFLSNKNATDQTYTRGYPIKIGKIFDYEYVDIQIDCKDRNCNTERFYFKDNVTNVSNMGITLWNSFNWGKKVIIGYKGCIFKNITSLEPEDA